MAGTPAVNYMGVIPLEKATPSASENIVRPGSIMERGKNSRKICCSAMISLVLLASIGSLVYYLTKIDEQYEHTEPSIEFPIATDSGGQNPMKVPTPLKSKVLPTDHFPHTIPVELPLPLGRQGTDAATGVNSNDDSDDDSFPSHTLKSARHSKDATGRSRTTGHHQKSHATTASIRHRLRHTRGTPGDASTTSIQTEAANDSSKADVHGVLSGKRDLGAEDDTRILVCVVSAYSIATADRYPPAGLCHYVIYAPVGYAKGHLRQNGSGFELDLFKEQARTTTASSWGIGLAQSEALSAAKGIWGEDAKKFREEVQRLVRAFRVVGYGLLDVHLTATDYIDTMNDYQEFYKYFREALQRMQYPSGAAPFLFFGVRVLNMIYSHRDTFRDKVREVVKYVDIFIYQTHVSRVTRNCLSVFPSNRYYPGADDQDSLDDAVRTLTPSIYHRRGFHIVISLTLSLLRFAMKGPDLEQIRKPCKTMTKMSFTAYCNSSGFNEDIEDEFQIGVYRYNEHDSLVDTFETSEVIEFKMEDVLRELQYGGVHVGFAVFNVEQEDARGQCGKSFARLKTVAKFLKNFS